MSEMLPFVPFRFVVSIYSAGDTGELIGSAAFSEVTGLEATMTPKTLAEGGRHWGEIQRVGQTTFSTVVLKRGVTDHLDLYSWFDAVAGRGQHGLRRTAQIDVYDRPIEADGGARGEPRLTFFLTRALPVKFKAPDLSATADQVAIEELHLAHEGISLQRPSEPNGGPNFANAYLYKFHPPKTLSSLESPIKVHFNPASLNVSLSNNIKAGSGGNAKAQQRAEHVSEGRSSLSLELLFDTTESGGDVRNELVKIVQAFLMPREENGVPQPPHTCLFVWGTFLFAGLVSGYQERLDFFSAQGVPLRATLSLTLETNGLQYSFRTASGPKAPAVRASDPDAPLTDQLPPGTEPNWREAAAANDVEEPRFAGVETLNINTP